MDEKWHVQELLKESEKYLLCRCKVPVFKLKEGSRIRPTRKVNVAKFMEYMRDDGFDHSQSISCYPRDTIPPDVASVSLLLMHYNSA